MTPLERLIREIIAGEGPMRLDRYMELCLSHPQHGYYMGRDPIGEAGDFITAPEVSQAFGELIGVWCIACWRNMGLPARCNLVELGPGRGTLMADILRTVDGAAPDFSAALQVHLVETSPALRERQRQTLGGRASWHDTLEEVPAGASIFVANEFFDAIPIRQFERREGRWFERVAGIEGRKLAMGLVQSDIQADGSDGDIIEQAPKRAGIASQIGSRLRKHPGCALIIDYGHATSAPGDTLQAVRKHRPVPIFEAPGECDITSHVDFGALGSALKKAGALALSLLTQRAFLLAMGLDRRMEKLGASADPATREVLERQAARLAEPGQMGNLFKVLAAVSPGLSAPYPFGDP